MDRADITLLTIRIAVGADCMAAGLARTSGLAMTIPDFFTGGDGRPRYQRTPLFIVQDAYLALMSTLANLPPEAGGILAQDQSGVIQKFEYDRNAGCNQGAYRPTSEWVKCTCRRWGDSELCFSGFVHSHPYGYCALSPKDISSAKKFLHSNPSMQNITMGIVCGLQLVVFLVFPDGDVWNTNIYIIV